MLRSADRVVLRPADLVMVLLVRDDDVDHPMPVTRLREVGLAVRRLSRLGVPSVKIFASSRGRDGSGWAARDSLMCRAIAEAKAAAPEVSVMTETCLCSYTPDGECHLVGEDRLPRPRETVEALCEQAVAQAEAGADVVGPAAMLPWSTRRIRQALDDRGRVGTRIMPHLIFDSGLYAAYRATMDAAPASGGRRLFQLDPAERERAFDVALTFVGEGADALLLEPALFCLDVLLAVREARPSVPLAPFSVSGEYQRLRNSGGDLGLLHELFTMLKRSGAEQIITYAAAEVAQSLA